MLLMATSQPPPDPDPAPMPPSDLDQARRTSMAAERTWLAWWRTALGATAGAVDAESWKEDFGISEDFV